MPSVIRHHALGILARRVLCLPLILMSAVVPASTLASQQSVRHDDIVYVPSTSRTSIHRFDLERGSALFDITTDEPIDTMTVDAAGIYLASGRTVYRMDLDGQNRRPLTDATGEVAALATAGDALFATLRHSSDLLRVDKRAGGDPVHEFFWTTLFSPVTSADGRSLYGRGYDLVKLSLDEGGAPGLWYESPVWEPHDIGFELWLSDDGINLITAAGTVWSTADLRYRGALGGAVEHVSFRDSAFYVLREGRIVRYTDRLLQDGEVQLDETYRDTAVALHAHDAGVYVFGSGTSGLLDVTLIPFDAFGDPVSGDVPDANLHPIRPDRGFAVADGSLRLIDAHQRAIHAWSPTSKRFVGGISLSDYPARVGYHTRWDRLVVGYPTGRITLVDPTSGTESSFANVPGSIAELAATDEHVFVADDSRGAWLFDRDGERIEYARWGYTHAHVEWSSEARRLYLLREGSPPSDLHARDILPTGTFGADADTPYQHGDGFTPPIRVSPNGDRILLGSGRLFSGDTLELVEALAHPVSDARWTDDGAILSLTSESHGNDVTAFDDGSLDETRGTRQTYRLREVGTDLITDKTFEFEADYAFIVQARDRHFLVREVNGLARVFEWQAFSDDLDGDGVRDDEDDRPVAPNDEPLLGSATEPSDTPVTEAATTGATNLPDVASSEPPGVAATDTPAGSLGGIGLIGLVALRALRRRPLVARHAGSRTLSAR